MGRKSAATSTRDRKVPRTYRLAPGKVAAAQRVLRASTATEAIETALDRVLFRRGLISGTWTKLGVRIAPQDKTAR